MVKANRCTSRAGSQPIVWSSRYEFFCNSLRRQKPRRCISRAGSRLFSKVASNSGPLGLSRPVTPELSSCVPHPHCFKLAQQGDALPVYRPQTYRPPIYCFWKHSVLYEAFLRAWDPRHFRIRTCCRARHFLRSSTLRLFFITWTS